MSDVNKLQVPNILPQSWEDSQSDEKAFRRQAKNKSRISNKMERDRYKSSNNSKEWNKELRTKMSKEIKKNLDIKPESGVFGFHDELGEVHYGKIFEDFLVFVASLHSSANYRQLLLAFISYAKTFTDKAISTSLISYIVNLLKSDDMDSISYDVEYKPGFCLDQVHVPESFDSGLHLANILRNISNNFSSVAENPIFKKISYIISAAMCAGLLEQARLKWSVAGITMFSQAAYLKQIKASDLICAICDTFAYFIEGGVEFFKSGSLSKFLYSNSKIDSLVNDVTWLKANITHVRGGNLERVCGVDENDFDSKLVATTESIKELLRSLDGPEKTMMYTQLQKVYEVRSHFDVVRVSGGSREAPYVIQLFGPTSVGKTNLNSMISVAVGKMNGFSVDDKRIVTLNADDKFQSNMRGDTNVIILDDVFNTAATFLQSSPTAIINTIANNAPSYCNMAEVELKGKIPFNNRLLIISTNLEDMGASIGSNEPASIQRRAHLKIDVSVRPEFCKDGSHTLDHKKVAKHYLSLNIQPPLVEDLWYLNVTEPLVVKSKAGRGKDVVQYITLSDSEGLMDKCSLHRLLRFLKDHSAQFYINEKSRVLRQNGLSNRVHVCDDCGHIAPCCTCQPVLDIIAESYVSDGKDHLVDLADRISNNLVNRMPHWFIAFLIRHYFGDRICQFYTWGSIFARFLVFTLFSLLLFSRRDIILCFFFFLGFFYFEFQAWKYTLVLREMSMSDKIVHFVLDRVRKLRKVDLLSSLGVVGGIYYICKKFSQFRNIATVFAEGSLEPLSQEDIAQRDLEVNMWAKPKILTREIPRDLATATPDQVTNTVFNNLCVLRIQCGDKYRMSNAFMVKSNLFIMPYHMLFETGCCDYDHEPNELLITLQRREEGASGSIVVGTISRSHWVRILDKDFLLVSMSNTGSYADLTKLLPNQKFEGPVLFVHKNGDGSKRVEGVHIKPGRVKHSLQTFDGYTYFVKGGTKPGLCMSALITQGKGPHIAGFHLGGAKDGRGDAIGGYLTRSEVELAIIDLLDKNGDVPIFLPHSASNLPDKQYGMDVITSTDINPKSPVNFLENNDGILVLGSCHGGVTAISRVGPSLITDSVERHTGIPNKHGPPCFRPAYMPWYEGIKYVADGQVGFSQLSVDWAVEDYIRPIMDKIESDTYFRHMFGVIPMDVAINGIPGIRFMDAMVTKTSVGFPMSGPKEQYIKHLGPVGDYQDKIDFDDCVKEEVERILACHRGGFKGGAVYKASLKDEPTKIGKTKTRVIYCAPVAQQIITKMYFQKLVRIIQMHPILFESAVGINCAGPEWSALRDYISDGGSLDDRGFGVDYGRFDARACAQLSNTTSRIIMAICAKSGAYSEDDLTIMRGILTDAIFPVVAFNGTLLEYQQSFTSGDTLTVFRNGLGGSIYLRIGFYHLEVIPGHLCGTFRDHVRAITYGDDVDGATHHGVDRFNIANYADFMSHYGVVVTMPDKSEDFVELMPRASMDFLKRRDNFIDEIGCSVGKLELDSITKSLHCRLVSKNVSREEHACSVLEGAAGEIFLHGRRVYNDLIPKLCNVADDHNLHVPGLLKTFDERVEDWKSKYIPGYSTGDHEELLYFPEYGVFPIREPAVLPQELVEQIILMRDSVENLERVISLSVYNTQLRQHRRVVYKLSHYGKLIFVAFFTMFCLIVLSISYWYWVIHMPIIRCGVTSVDYIYNTTTGVVDYSLGWEPGVPHPSRNHCPIFIGRIFPGYTNKTTRVMGLTRVEREPGNTFSNITDYCLRGTDHSTQMSGTQGVDAPNSQSYISSPSCSNDDSLVISEETYVPEAGYGAYNIGQASNSSLFTTTQNTDINPGHVFTMGDTSDTTYSVADNPDAEFADFFKRPIIISQWDWNPNAVFDQTFNPWRQYLNNPRVANRVSNFRNLRGRLHVKFTLNGSQFYWGLMMASYTPLPLVDNFSDTGPSFQGVLMAESQKPHVYLDPNLSQGAEMILPFFWAYNSIELNSADMDNLGDLRLLDIGTLRHAQSATEPVQITIFAWMEDVVLSSPTAANVDGISPQSGEGDEYGQSPAKKMAEALVRTSGKLIDKPIIGPYAKATQMVLNMGLDVASALGMSKPNNVEHIMGMKAMACGALANTNVSDMTQKLTLDCKQEVSIDPRTVGLSPEDEMDLVSLACRESYLGQVTWSTTDAPEDVLWTGRVGPVQYNSSALDIQARQFSPSAWVALPFGFWRGTMKVRIKVLSSSFHKGRLRIHYDPAGAGSVPDMNVVTNHILDLAECKDFTIEIGWAQARSYCRVESGQDRSVSYAIGDFVGTDEFCNGSYCISVLNTLTVPNPETLTPVNILVFTSMCDDFEVQAPSSQHIQNYSVLPLLNGPPSLVASGDESAKKDPEMVPESAVIQDGENTCDPSAPVKDDEPAEATLASPMWSLTDQTPGIYFGESINNWKQCLKRYNLHRGWQNGTSITVVAGIQDLAISDFPMFRGYGFFGIDNAATGPYNVCDTTMLNWVVPAYAGYRGGLRWKYTLPFSRTANGRSPIHMQVTRTPGGNLGYLRITTATPNVYNPGEFARATRAQIAHTWSGATFTNGVDNSTVEAELPYQSNRRFLSGRRNNPNQANSEFPAHRMQIYCNEGMPAALSYVAAAEDFQCYFFVSVPPMAYRVDDPAITAP